MQCCLFRWLLLGILPVFMLSDLAISQPAASTPEKYWIFFRDKVGPAGKTADAAREKIDPHALERRARRGSSYSSLVDVSVSETYLEELRKLGIEPLVKSRWLNGVSAVVMPEQLPRLERLPFVREIRKVAKLEIDRKQSVPLRMTPGVRSVVEYGPSQTQLEVINAIAPLEKGINGEGIRLGFLDTEFDGFQHPVFNHLHNDGRLLADTSFVELPQTSYHGLSVASIAVGYSEGELIGPAHGAMVMAATTEYAPTETTQEEDNLVAGLEWLEANGVDVVNISLGYTTFDPGERSYTYDDLDGNTAITTVAADIAASLGVIVVTSAGNDGNGRWRYIGTPADGDSVIAVGAVFPDSVRASFSSVGPTADGRIKPDVMAPGASIFSNGQYVDGVWIADVGVHEGNTVYTYSYASGTSFSSPLVAGVVCQILQVNPDLGPIDVRRVLRNTASLASTPNNETGWGIINADAAVREAERLKEGGNVTDEVPFITVYPNPSTGEAVFEIRSGDTGGSTSRLSIFDSLGRRVAVPFEGTLQPDLNIVVFQAGNLVSGVYFYMLETENLKETGKLVFIR